MSLQTVQINQTPAEFTALVPEAAVIVTDFRESY